MQKDRRRKCSSDPVWFRNVTLSAVLAALSITGAQREIGKAVPVSL